MGQIYTNCNQKCKYIIFNRCLLPYGSICPMTNVSYNANQLADITKKKIDVEDKDNENRRSK